MIGDIKYVNVDILLFYCTVRCTISSSQSEQTTRSSDLTTHKKAITATTISATVNNRKPSKGASWSNTTYNPSNYAPTTGSKITVKTGNFFVYLFILFLW